MTDDFCACPGGWKSAHREMMRPIRSGDHPQHNDHRLGFWEEAFCLLLLPCMTEVFTSAAAPSQCALGECARLLRRYRPRRQFRCREDLLRMHLITLPDVVTICWSFFDLTSESAFARGWASRAVSDSDALLDGA